MKRDASFLAVGLVLLFGGVSVALIQYKVPTILMPLMETFSLDSTTASWLMSIFTLMTVLFAIPASILAIRFGEKRVMISGLLLAIVGSILGLFSESSVTLLFSRALEGIALTIVTACGPILVRRCVPERRLGITMGIWGIWGCLGSTIASVTVPTLFSLGGFGAVWSVYAAVAATAALALGVMIHVPESPKTSEQHIPEEKRLKLLSQIRQIVNKETVLFYVAFALFNICLLAVLAFVPTILQMNGYDSTLSGFLSTAPMLLSIASAPLFGALSDRTGKLKGLLVLAMFVMGPCTFVMYNYTGAALIVGVLVMGLVGMGGIGLFLTGYSQLVEKENMTTAMGLFITVQGIGQFLGTFLVQALLGPEFTNTLFAGMLLLVMGLIGAGVLCKCKIGQDS